MQATLYHVNGVLLVPLVVQIGDVYYGTWINAWNEHRDGLRSLDLLASQDRLTFAFYQPATGAEPRRVIRGSEHTGRQRHSPGLRQRTHLDHGSSSTRPGRRLTRDSRRRRLSSSMGRMGDGDA